MGREMVVFKGTRNGLVIVLDPNREYEEIRNTLLKKMESAKGFLKALSFPSSMANRRSRRIKRVNWKIFAVSSGWCPMLKKNRPC